MLKSKLIMGTLSVFCLVLWVLAAHAGNPERPNRGKELYVPPWDKDIISLATSCKDLAHAECGVLRRLMLTPHAYWVGLDPSIHFELNDLHDLLLDAKSMGQIPTIVLYSLPDRDCGGGAPLSKSVTTIDYERWVAMVADAVLYHKMAANIIVEPGGLSRMITEPEALCRGRSKDAVLHERIDLIRNIVWNFIQMDETKKNRLNPNVRIFVDVGGPGTISSAREKVAMAKVLEDILKVAQVDGISVNVGGHASFEESRAWAEELIGLLWIKAKRDLTVAIDMSRSGSNVGEGCNVPGTALGAQRPTLDYPDKKVELVMVIQDPSTSDGKGDGCHGGGPAGFLDLPIFRAYLQSSAAPKRHTASSGR